MVKVAISGATSVIGSSLVREILSSTEHGLVVLSRSAQPELTDRGVDVRVVNYLDVDELSAALQGVHTVLSCIWAHGPEVGTSQLSLLEAAQAAGVRRFVPSDWATDKYHTISAYAPKVAVWNAVKESGLEYTRFNPGIWMNVFGVDAPKDKMEALAGYVGPHFLVDLHACKATLPGDGNQKVVFMHTRDIAQFVVAALDMERWEPDSRLIGDRLTYMEVVELAEKVMGKKFELTYVPVKQLESVLAGGPDSWTKFFHEFMLAIAKGELDFEDAPLMNRFPSIKPMTAEDFLKNYWVS